MQTMNIVDIAVPVCRTTVFGCKLMTNDDQVSKRPFQELEWVCFFCERPLAPGEVCRCYEEEE